MSNKTLLKDNLETLSNATELASRVIHSISGEEISNTLEGRVLELTDIKEAVVAKIQGSLVTRQGGN